MVFGYAWLVVQHLALSVLLANLPRPPAEPSRLNSHYYSCILSCAHCYWHNAATYSLEHCALPNPVSIFIQSLDLCPHSGNFKTILINRKNTAATDKNRHLLTRPDNFYGLIPPCANPPRSCTSGPRRDQLSRTTNNHQTHIKNSNLQANHTAD